MSEIEQLPILKNGTVVNDLGVYMTSLLDNFRQHLGYYDPDTSTGQDEITVSGGHGGIGSISNIRIDSNIKTDPQQKRRGLLYNIGDPVVVYGGLNDSNEARDAEAFVYEVSQGSIEGVNVLFGGYGYRNFYNTITTVISSPSDDAGSNASANIIVGAIDTTSVSGDSQNSYFETIDVDKMPIEYIANYTLSAADYSILSTNNRNIVITIQNAGLPYYNGEYVYANGDSYLTANFKGKILTSNSGWAGGPSDVVIYGVQNTVPLSTSGFLVGTNKLIGANSARTFSVNTLKSSSLAANISSTISQVLVYETLDTGGIALFNVINGGYGFRTVPQIDNTTYYDTYWSAATYDNDPFDATYAATRQPISAFGKIAHIYIDNGGSGYANGDSIVVSGRGYGFAGYVNVNATGVITQTTITNRGEGYFGAKTVRVANVSPITANATLSVYGYSEGVELAIDTSAIGRVKTIKVSNRGYDYISAPIVSLKVADIVINEVPEPFRANVAEGNIIYQGEIDNPTFRATIKSYVPSSNVMRVFNYSGLFDTTSTINTGEIVLNEEGELVDESTGYVVSLNSTANVPAPILYPVGVIATGLPNPFFYGNGKARAVADFFNGLIKYNGFFINTDGFVSADKKLQDANVYHNYSYVIESEKSLTDYKNIITDIIHPIGTSMLSRTVAYNPTVTKTLEADSFVYYASPIETVTTANVQILNSYSNIITGNGTTFSSTLVGNIINIIDGTNPLRSRSMVVTKRNTSTNVEVEGWFVYTGQGKLETASQNLLNTGIVATIYGRALSTNGTVSISKLNGRVTVTENILDGRANVFTVNTTVNGLSTSFTSALSVGDRIYIANTIKVVATVPSASQITVNSAFAANSTNQRIYKLTANLLQEFSTGDFIIVNGQEKKITTLLSERQIAVNSAFSIKATDQIYFKANVSPDTANVYRTSGTIISGNVFVNDIIRVNAESRRVVNIASGVIVTNAPFSYSATSQDVYRIDKTTFRVVGNTNSISDFIATNDTIRFNIAQYNEKFRAVNSSGTPLTANITKGSNVVTRGFSYTVSSFFTVGDQVTINNETKIVLSLNATQLNVDSVFSSNANNTIGNNALYIRGKNIDANIISLSGNTITTNVTYVSSNTEDMVYFVVPDYTKRDYQYSFITISE